MLCLCASVALPFKSSNPVIPALCAATVYFKALSDKDACTINNEIHSVLVCATGDCVDT